MDNLAILFLVVLLMVAFLMLPAMRRRTGGRRFSLFGQDKASLLHADPKAKTKPDAPKPKSYNSTGASFKDYLAFMIRFAHKNGYTLVYPGTVAVGGQRAMLPVLMVTPGGVVGLHCLGFGGTIRGGVSARPWRQYVEEKSIDLPNPVLAGAAQAEILRAALDSLGRMEVPIEVLPVFTNPKAELLNTPGAYTKASACEYLAQDKFHTGPVSDVLALGKQLSALAAEPHPDAKSASDSGKANS